VFSVGEAIRTLLVHDDQEVVGLLGGLLASNGCVVESTASLEDAIARLDEYYVVIAPWDRPLGQAVYRWVLAERKELRFRFVFVADEIPEQLEEAAARGRVVRLGDPDGLLDATAARAARVTRGHRTRLLVIDEDEIQLAVMAELLAAEGFDVRTADSAGAAAGAIGEAEPDVVLADWTAPDGIGREIHDWITARQPELLARVVFVTGGSPRIAPVPVAPKGQDLKTLLRLLRGAATASMAAGTPPRGTNLNATRDR
jgi:CheY-like chemotaxis protein